jgi:hypothetical protein
LTEQELKRLRSDCTEKIYIKDTVHFDQTLLDLDNRLTELLAAPYIENYRSDISCIQEDKDFILKTSCNKYWIVNPGEKKAEEIFDGKLWMLEIPGNPTADLFKILKFKVRIDQGVEEDWVDRVVCKRVDNSDSSVGHKVHIYFTDKNDQPIKWAYDKTIEIEVEDQRLVPAHDNIYVKRIDKTPIKNLHITYKIDGMNCKLEGNCFGTLSSTSSGTIRVVRHDNSIGIESFSWLLPGNGIMIAMLPKSTPKG